MAMAAGAGIAFLYLNNKIKTKANLSAMGKDMPSLNTFDNVNHWSILIGFLCTPWDLLPDSSGREGRFPRCFPGTPKKLLL